MRFRNHHAGCCGYNPTRPDGTEWAHIFTLHDGSTIHADTAAEVIEEILPGYGLLDEEGRRTARGRLAQRLASQGQEVHVALAVRAGRLDPADPQDAALIDILRADKALSMRLEDADAPGGAAEWVPETPLVLVATSYEPHTGYPRIAGNTAWLDPTTDASLLTSLREAGFFDYWTNSPTC